MSLLIPLISAFLIYLERKQIFRTQRYCPSAGVPLLVLAAGLWVPVSYLKQADRLSAIAALIVLVWIAGFVLFYGIASFQVGGIPATVPVPHEPAPGCLHGTRRIDSAEGVRRNVSSLVPDRGSTCRPTRFPIFFARSRD